MWFNSHKFKAIQDPNSLERFGKSLVAQGTESMRELPHPSQLESSKPFCLRKALIEAQKTNKQTKALEHVPAVTQKFHFSSSLIFFPSPLHPPQ